MKTVNDLLKKLKCYDSPTYMDRYTVVYTFIEETGPHRSKKLYSAVGMSAYPFSPQGFGQHTTAQLGKHLGKKITFDALPEDCKKLVMQDLNDYLKSWPDVPMGM